MSVVRREARSGWLCCAAVVIGARPARCLLGCSDGGVRAGCAPTGCQSRSSLVGVPLVHVLLFVRLVSLVGDDPGVTANTTGLPGLVQLRSIVGGMLTFGLVACVAALVASAVTWGFGVELREPAPGRPGQDRCRGVRWCGPVDRGGERDRGVLLRRRRNPLTRSSCRDV